MGVELSKQKIAFIQNQEECSVKEEESKTVEHFFRQQDKAQKVAEHIFRATEHRFKQQEEPCKGKETYLP